MKRFTNLMVFVCGAAATLGGPLFAESWNAVEVHVPFDFVAAGRKLPAGDYTISESGSGMVIHVSGYGRGNSVMLTARPGAIRAGQGASATFEVVGSDRYLSELHMGDDRVLEIPVHVPQIVAGASNAMTGGH